MLSLASRFFDGLLCRLLVTRIWHTNMSYVRKLLFSFGEHCSERTKRQMKRAIWSVIKVTKSRNIPLWISTQVFCIMLNTLLLSVKEFWNCFHLSEIPRHVMKIRMRHFLIRAITFVCTIHSSYVFQHVQYYTCQKQKEASQEVRRYEVKTQI